MFCTNCGAKNEDGNVFCEQCGARLIAENPQTEPTEVFSYSDVGAFTLPADEAQPDASSTPTPATTEPATTKTPIKRSTIILLCCLGALAALLLIAYFTLRSTVFSPTGPLRSYVNAISEGDYQQANSLVDPGVSNDSRVLLTPDVAKDAANRIQNVEIGALNQDKRTNEYISEVSFTINGVHQTRSLKLEPRGRVWLFFDNWKVTTPMLDQWHVSVPSSMHAVDVNGMSVDLSKVGGGEQTESPQTDSTNQDVTYSDMTQYTLPSYPGVYSVSIAKSKYFSSDTVKITEPDQEAVLTPEPTDELTDELLDAIKNHIKECTASKELTLSEDCEFADGDFYYNAEGVSDIKREVVGTPTLNKLDISTGEFSTNTVNSKISYKQRSYFSDNLEDESTTDSGSITGTFSLEDEKLSVTFGASSGYSGY